jgi:acyl-CoA reductase-like NAD-dependent aldehyde dehydrogenase
MQLKVCLKNAPVEAALLAHNGQAVTGETPRAEQVHILRRQIDKIARDLEDLMNCMRGNNIVDQDIVSEIESMIGQLTSLCRKMKSIEGKDTCKKQAMTSAG